MTGTYDVVDLDANATTRLAPEVRDTILRAFDEAWGNSSSDNRLGEIARSVVAEARRSIAELVGARADEIIFTSGATEAINLAIRGVFGAVLPGGDLPEGGVHIVTSTIEHPAVLATVEHLQERYRIDVTALPPSPDGQIAPQQVQAALRRQTCGPS